MFASVENKMKERILHTGFYSFAKVKSDKWRDKSPQIFLTGDFIQTFAENSQHLSLEGKNNKSKPTLFSQTICAFAQSKCLAEIASNENLCPWQLALSF